MARRTRFETEISANSLSLSSAAVTIVCERMPKSRVEWFAENGEMLWRSDNADSFFGLDFFAERSTGIRSRTAELSSVEHLSAVLALYPQFGFEIRAHAKELPILDGSAYPWYEAVRSLAGIPQELAFYDVAAKGRFEWSGGFLEYAPAETLEIEYSISHGNFSNDVFVSIYDAEDLVGLFPARTFIFEDDLEKARAAGLLSAVSEGSGMLLDESSGHVRLISGGRFRMPGETVRHKALDLIGDLALPAPFLPKLRIRIHNGGHVAHRKLLERIFDYAARNTSQVG